MDTSPVAASRESVVRVKNGWMMLGLSVAIVGVDVGLLVTRGLQGSRLQLLIPLSLVAVLFLLPGLFSLQPNQARVLVLFGAYRGTVRESGFHWGNPFYSNGQQSLVLQLAEAQKKNAGRNDGRLAGSERWDATRFRFGLERLTANP